MNADRLTAAAAELRDAWEAVYRSRSGPRDERSQLWQRLERAKEELFLAVIGTDSGPEPVQ